MFPLCTGGELYEHVIRRGHFSERDAAVIMHDLMSGLHALHERDILHLDIKPENILFETEADDSRIKITDFGLSKVFSPQQSEQSLRNVSVDDMAKKLKNFQESGVLQRDRLRGTVGYMSPELILAGVSSAATDVWAAGVVLYILLCGHPPFQSKSNRYARNIWRLYACFVLALDLLLCSVSLPSTKNVLHIVVSLFIHSSHLLPLSSFSLLREILERSAKGQYSLEGKEWEGVSEDAKDLVRKMLTVDPERRITVAACLRHPWILSVSGPAGGSSAGAQNAVAPPPPLSRAPSAGLDKHQATAAAPAASAFAAAEGNSSSLGRPPVPPNAAAAAAAVGSSSAASSGAQPRNVHLGNALHALSTHVKDRRMEKMAVSFTRLVSTLQSDTKKQDRRRMIDTLLDRDGNAAASGQGDPDAGMFVLSQDYKDAVVSAFRSVGKL